MPPSYLGPGSSSNRFWKFSHHDMSAAYLKDGLAVGHGGGALGADNHRDVETVAGEGRRCTRNAEGLCQRVPGLLTEDGVHQLDDLVL